MRLLSKIVLPSQEENLIDDNHNITIIPNIAQTIAK